MDSIHISSKMKKSEGGKPTQPVGNKILGESFFVFFCFFFWSFNILPPVAKVPETAKFDFSVGSKFL